MQRSILSLKIIIFVLAFSLGCSSPCPKSPVSNATKEYTFVVAADPQLFWGSIENWQQTIKEINKISPDFVVVCGDMTNTEGDANEIGAYWENAKKLSSGIKLYNVAGNHDIRAEHNRKDIDLYKKNYGSLYYSFIHKNSLFIILETGCMKNSNDGTNLYLAKKQIRWLGRILADSYKAGYLNRFVFLHHPIILGEINENEEYFNLPVEFRNELLDQCSSHNVKFIFSGHLHQNRITQFKDISLVTTGSCGKALQNSDLGFRVVRVSGTKVEHSFYILPDQTLR